MSEKKLKREFQAVAVGELVFDSNDLAKQDLYIYLEKSDQYLVFLSRGDLFSELKKKAFYKHSLPILYVRAEEHKEITVKDSVSKDIRTKEVIKTLKLDAFGEKGQAEVRQLCLSLHESSDEKAEILINKLGEMSDSFIDALVPDLRRFKEGLVAKIKDINVMSDSAAISSLAAFFGLANYIEDKESFKSIFMASLIMDFPLAKYSLDEIHLFQLEPDELNPSLLIELRKHPKIAYHSVQENIVPRGFPLSATEIILHHHELYNGQGYPTGVKSGTLSELTQIVALAVDVFDRLKEAQFKDDPRSLLDILDELEEKRKDNHQRRHNPTIMTRVRNFLVG